MICAHGVRLCLYGVSIFRTITRSPRREFASARMFPMYKSYLGCARRGCAAAFAGYLCLGRIFDALAGDAPRREWDPNAKDVYALR